MGLFAELERLGSAGARLSFTTYFSHRMADQTQPSHLKTCAHSAHIAPARVRAHRAHESQGTLHAQHAPAAEWRPRAAGPSRQGTPGAGGLPWAEDSEKGVLSSMLIAPRSAILHCLEQGLAAVHFHKPAHGLIYEALTYLWSERMLPGDGSDFIPLTEYLRGAGLLEQAGGAAYVTELFTYLPTAANVAQYAETVVEQAVLREMIAFHTRQAARCREEPGAVWELLAEMDARVQALEERRGHEALATLLECRIFDPARPPAAPEAVLSLDGKCVATPENFMVVQAKVKAGKTAVLGAIMAATMEVAAPATPGAARDCLGFTASNPRGHAVVHFDTEQSRYHHHLLIARALQRGGRTEPPPWLRSYYLKGMSVAQRLEALRCELRRAQRACGGIHLVILDGIADYCQDVNDAEEAVALVATIEALAVEYATVFIVVIHENPATDIGKTRGHLGSHLERKAETPLRLEKDADGVTVMFADRARGTHITREEGIRFAWDDEAKMHLRLTHEAARAVERTRRVSTGGRANDRLCSAKAALGKYFAHGQVHARAALLVSSGMKEGTFSAYWQRLRDEGLIRANAAVWRMFEASEGWAKELAADFPAEGGNG
jgi:hypothetical protein